jgi:HAD superfamily hydrolase (TIGR01509 family)
MLLNWSAIDTVLLDMDGTLLDLHFDNYFWQELLPERFAELNRQTNDDARHALAARFDSERGNLNWYCVDYWSRELNIDIAALKQEISHLISIRPFVPEFLHALKNSGRQVWLVTNAHRKSLQIKMQHTQISHYFDKLIVSHEHGAPKEDPQFWRTLHTLHPFNPARTLFVDDTASVLQSAQQFGIAHLLTLLQPDSKQAKRLHSEFPSIHHFDELLPLPALTAAN